MFSLLLPIAHAGTCADYEAPTRLGAVDECPVTESSGLARARTRPGTWFTHEDSGGSATLYAFQLDGTYIGENTVEDALFVDWESMSDGPCPGDHDSPCLFIGDIGDNLAVRPFVTIYVVAEPALGAPAPVLHRYDLTWPDGPIDSEAVLVHPFTGDIYLIAKSRDGISPVVRVEPDTLEDATPTPMQIVDTLQIEGDGDGARMVTGADWDDVGERLAVRTYGQVLIWDTDPCDADEPWDREPDWSLPITDGQGETIGFDSNGDLIGSNEGDPMGLTRVRCVDFTENQPCPDAQDTGDPGIVDDTADTGRDGAPHQDSPASSDGCGCHGGSSSSLLLLPLWLLAGRRRPPRPSP